MSFILDALKKSEEERRKGEAPRLHEGPPPAGSGKSSRWFLLLVLALTLNGVVFGWWLLSGEQESASPDLLPAAENPAASVKATSPPEPVQAEAVRTSPTQSKESPASPPETASAAPAPEAKAQPVGTKMAEAVSAVAVDRVVMEEAEPAAAPEAERELSGVLPPDPEPERAPEPSFPSLADLSPSLRAGLPALELQLHFFIDEPNRRLVRLNGINLREGEETADGLRIVGIDPDGVRLVCNGTRLFLPAGG